MKSGFRRISFALDVWSIVEFIVTYWKLTVLILIAIGITLKGYLEYAGKWLSDHPFSVLFWAIFILSYGCFKLVLWLLDTRRPRPPLVEGIGGKLAIFIVLLLFIMSIAFLLKPGNPSPLNAQASPQNAQMSAPNVQINIPSKGIFAEKPEVRGEIEGLWVSARENEKTAIVLVASVSNLGLPSIVDGWSLKGKVLTKAPNSSASPVDVPDGFKLHFGGYIRTPTPPPNTEGCLHGRDNLVSKTFATPLKTGEKQRGILFFLADVDVTSIGLPMEFFLTYKDVTGTVYPPISGRSQAQTAYGGPRAPEKFPGDVPSFACP